VTRDLQTLTRASNAEQVDSTHLLDLPGANPREISEQGPALKPNARNSASSSTLCGREAVAAQRNSRR